jgi:hypothetical protein
MSFDPPGCELAASHHGRIAAHECFWGIHRTRDALYKALRDKRDSTVQAGTNESLSPERCP